MPDCDELLTEGEAAAEAKVSTKTIRRLIASGRLEHINLGTGQARGLVRIARSALARVKPLDMAEAQGKARKRRRRSGAGGPAAVW